MSKYELARRYSTENIISRAFSEYAKNAEERYKSIVGYFSTLLEYDAEIDNMSMQEYIIANLKELGIDINARLTLNDGLYNISELSLSMLSSIASSDNSDASSYETPCIIINVDGQASSSLTTIESICQEINNTYHAMVCTSGVAFAYSASNTISERISLTRDYVGQVFTSSFADYSGYLENAIENIRTDTNVIDWISSLMHESGIDGASEEDILFENSQSCLYTGATPAGALCWNTVGDKLVSGVKVAAIAVKTVVGGIVNLGAKLFGKIKDKVVSVTTNPYDLTEINKSSDRPGHTIDGVANQQKLAITYDKNESNSAILYSANYLKFLPVNKFIHMDYFCSEHMLSLQMDSDQKKLINGSIISSSIMDNVNNAVSYLSTQTNHTNILSLLNDVSGMDDTNILDAIRSACYELGYNMKYSYGAGLYGLMMYQSTLSSYWDKLNDNDITIYQASTILVSLAYAVKLKNLANIYVIIRYKSLNAKQFAPLFDDPNIWQNRNSSWLISTDQLISIFDKIISSNDIYADTSDTEVNLYNSFILSRKVDTLLTNLLLAETVADITEDDIRSFIEYSEWTIPNINSDSIAIHFYTGYDRTPFSINRNTVALSNNDSIGNISWMVVDGTNITNKDFFYAALGLTNNSAIIGHIPFRDIYYSSIDNVGKDAGIFYNIKAYQNVHPLDYPFWPYEKDFSRWNDASFSIKTDQENLDALTTFIAMAIVVTTAIVIGVTAKFLIKRVANKAYLKQQAAQYEVIDKIRSGTLTSQDMKQLRKSTKRLNMINKLSGNTVSSVGSTSNNIVNPISLDKENDNSERLKDIMKDINDSNEQIQDVSRDVNDNNEQINLSLTKLKEIITG